MICPECGTEYRVGFDKCADCGVDLVSPPEAAPAPEQRDPSSKRATDPEWVVVLKLYRSDQVAVARAMFDSESIPHVCQGHRLTQIGIGQAEPARFLVPPIHLDRAREIVEQFEAGFQESENPGRDLIDQFDAGELEPEKPDE